MALRLHLCFNITEKGQTIVPDWYNRILDSTKKYRKKNVIQSKFNENQIQIRHVWILGNL